MMIVFPVSLRAGGGKETVSAPAPPAEDPGGWKFSFTPYGWAMGLNGVTGIGSFTSETDVDSMDVINHLNGAFFLQAEARHGRWGILFDGYYARLSGGGSTPGLLYSQAEFKLDQAMAELAVAYRVLEGPAGSLDVLAGARYNSMALDLHADISDRGVREASERAADRLVSEVEARAKAAVARRAAEIRAAAAAEAEGIRGQLRDQLLENLGDRLRPGLGSAARSGPGLSSTALGQSTRRLDGVWRDYIQAAVDARVASLRADLRHRPEQKLAAAEKRLARAIERELRQRLPENVSADKNWVDPFVGFRARWNITQALYLAGRGDIGGFGLGSDLTWQASASVGYQISEHWSSEFGYRHMDVDYTDGHFLFDMVENGLFLSLTYAF